MNPITCSVIRDLLPLYAEDLLSSDSCALVREHLETCPSCRSVLEELKTPAKAAAEVPLRQVRKRLHKTNFLTALLCVCLAAVLMLTAFARLTERTSVPYSEDAITLEQHANGSIELFFDPASITDWDIYYEPVEGIRTLYLEAWYCPLDRFLGQTPRSLLITEEKCPDRIIYVMPDEETVLLWGKELIPGGGMIVLSRLTLGYYVLLALGLAAVLGLLTLLLRRTKAAKPLQTAFLLPVGWIIGHLCIKGIAFTSNFAVRDFLLILFTALAVFGALFAAGKLLPPRSAK